jgi:transposase
MGPLTALAYVLIIGTPNRFHRGKHNGNYLGMIPSEDSSGGEQGLGHISKPGNSLLRFLLVEAARAAARNNADWRRYTQLAVRRLKCIAKVAMGRRLGVRLYWMWRNGSTCGVVGRQDERHALACSATKLSAKCVALAGVA